MMKVKDRIIWEWMEILGIHDLIIATTKKFQATINMTTAKLSTTKTTRTTTLIAKQEEISVIDNKDKEDWSKLTADLVEQIGELLKSDIADYIRFRSVCTAWRSATTDLRDNKRPLPPQIPWLIMDFDKAANKLLYFNPSDRKEHYISLPYRMLWGTKRIGFSHKGWLVIEDYVSFDLFMLNPLTRAWVTFPSTSTLTQYQQMRETYKEGTYLVGSIATDCSPNSISCTFVVCLMPVLAAFRTGDKTWIVLEDNGNNFTDVIHFKGRFIAAEFCGQILVFNSKLERLCVMQSPRPWIAGCRRWSLVESPFSNSLLLLRVVHRWLPEKAFPDIHPQYKRHTIRTVEIWSLNLEEDATNAWTEIKSLHDHTFFVGCCRTVSVPSAIFPIVEPDSFVVAEEYFSNSRYSVNIKPGVYCLKTQKSEALPWDQISGLRWLKPCFR